jgi:hypothetical protein
MSAETGSLRLVADHLVQAIAPLDVVFRDPDQFRTVMWRLGWKVEDLPSSYVTVADAARQALDAAGALVDGASITEVLAVIDRIGTVYRTVEALTATPAGVVDAAAFRSGIPRQLLEHLLAEYLDAERPGLFSTLEAIGVVAFEDVPAADGRPAYVRTRFTWEAIPRTLADPASIPAIVYGWGSATFDFSLLNEIVSELFAGLDLPSSVDDVDPTFADAIQAQAAAAPAGPIESGQSVAFFDVAVDGTFPGVGLAITELPAEGSALPGILIRPQIPDGIASGIDIGDGWTFALRPGTDLTDELAVVLRPGETSVRYPFAPGQALPPAGFGASLTYDAGAPFVLFGDPAGIRVEVARATFSGDLDLIDDGLELSFAVEPQGLAVVLTAGALDSFLRSVLGISEARIEIPCAIRWSSRGGLDFTAGVGLEVAIPLGLTVGGIRIELVDLAIRLVAGDANTTAELALRTAVTCAGAVGPIVFSADGLGIELPIVFRDGNAGPFDVGFGVVWPAGLGIGVAVDGVVSGGGFLAIDTDAGRYAGTATLQLIGVGITAMGIVQTTLPGDPDAWSFFLSLSASFTALQLGFGFTLNGVGGLIGINRTVNVDALSDGVRTGALDSILFPEDPVGDAVQILSDLETVFPPAVGQCVVGPVAQIGWGTPTLVEVSLGVIVQLPDPITISLLGLLSSVLPSANLPLLELRIDVAGTLNLTEGTLAVDASLRDSRLVGLVLTGDAAIRASFLEDPTLLIAFGGFNPHFKPPDDFPDLGRLSVALDTGDTLRIGLSGYFALTSNTVQFGATADVWAQVSEITAEGYFSFDALIDFNPFGFVIDYDFSVSVRAGELELCGVTLSLMLEGPKPWHALGTAMVTVLGLDTPFRVDETIGARQGEGPVTTVSARTQLIDALTDVSAWSAVPSNTDANVVVLADSDKADRLVRVHPVGVVQVRQRVVPLKRTLDHYGQATLADGDRFEITAPTIGGEKATSTSTVEDWFAPAQYFALDDADKVSSPSFEMMPCGLQFGDDGVEAGTPRSFALDYEQIIRDPALGDDRPLATTFRLSAEALAASVKRSLVARARRSARLPTSIVTSSPFAVTSTRYVVTDTHTGRIARTLTPATGVSWSIAREGLVGAAATGRLQLEPAYELDEAAA